MKYYTRSQGFTLVEMFVAVLVLVMAVLGPMTLFSRLISDGMYARDQVVASYLAKEGLELAIEKENRDPGGDWSEDCLDGCLLWLDKDGDEIGIEDNPGDDSLYLKAGSSGKEFYVHQGDEENRTGFRRTIKVDELDSGFDYIEIAEVTSTVIWSGGLINRETELTTYIYSYDFD